MKGLLILLLLALGYFTYHERQRSEQLEADLAASQEKVTALEKRLAAVPTPTPLPASSRVTQPSANPLGQTPALSSSTSSPAPAGAPEWMWKKGALEGSSSQSPKPPSGGHR